MLTCVYSLIFYIPARWREFCLGVVWFGTELSPSVLLPAGQYPSASLLFQVVHFEPKDWFFAAVLLCLLIIPVFYFSSGVLFFWFVAVVLFLASLIYAVGLTLLPLLILLVYIAAVCVVLVSAFILGGVTDRSSFARLSRSSIILFLCAAGFLGLGLSLFLIPSAIEGPLAELYPKRASQLLWQYFLFFSPDILSFLPLFSSSCWALILLGFLLCVISICVDWLLTEDGEKK